MLHPSHIGDVVVGKMFSDKYLDILFVDKLVFVYHIHHILGNSYAKLGFVGRNCMDFRNVNTLTAVFVV